MKKVARNIIVSILGWQVKRLQSKYKFTTIAVAGSVGKTSTKFAIAAVLGQRYRVRYQEGNYNDLVSVPLVFFGLSMPSPLNPFAWLRVFINIERQLRNDFPYDVVVLEIGTDGPGQIVQFTRYLHVDIGVLTAIAPEHMEFFPNLDDVANEELMLSNLSQKLLVNKDLCEEVYLRKLKTPYITYSIKQPADYLMTNIFYVDGGYDFNIIHRGKTILRLKHEAIAETQLYSVCAAIATSLEQGVPVEKIETGIQKIQPVAGRMQQLRGFNNSLIIDDTYNASPIAMKAALDTIYKIDAPQKIAILGNMNELGIYSEPTHKEIGEYCDPKQLDIVVTIGPDANEFLAPAAKEKGCDVKTFTSPYEAGEYLKPLVKEKALILAKGSQNGVFAEETVKLLLDDPADFAKLVRQSGHWLAVKQKQFK